MKFKLRNAKQTDMRSVLFLIKELATFEKEPHAVELTENDLIKDGFGKEPAFKAFVAEADNEIVGMALFYQRYSTWKGKTIHLEDLIVKQEFRGKGIGNALYTKVLKYAFKNNFKRVAWEVLDWNKVAIDFYKSTGAKVFDDWKVAQIDESALKSFVENI
ncbi:MAG: GNAT family N-acetyltransferase [Bacteroidota bacterium]